MMCRDRLHELVKEEIEKKDSSTEEWKIAMESGFNRMDNEVILCELDQFLGYQTHQCSDSPGGGSDYSDYGELFFDDY
ncbi:unnamed protein product [Camellia sinensis]